MPEERTPRNAPGPFYVVKDQCMSCGAPEAEARGLVEYDEESSSCFFARQPRTDDETYRAIRAVWVSCSSALRYDGSDSKVTRRLCNVGDSKQVDHSSVVRFDTEPRRAATFGHPAVAASEVLVTIAQDLVAHYSKATFVELAADAGAAVVLYSWRSDLPGARLTVQPSWDGVGRWSIRIDASDSHATRRIGVELDDAFGRTGMREVRWYRKLKSRQWESLPI